MTRQRVDRLYSEIYAAEVMGIKPRSLRTERQAGRIGYKRVAGKVMYRESDLIAWQNQGIAPCHDRTEDRASSPSRKRAGSAASTTSAGPKTAAHASVQRAKAISNELKRSSRSGCSLRGEESYAAPMIPMRRQ